MEGMRVIGEMGRHLQKIKSITDPTFGKRIRNQYLMRVYNRWGLLSLYFLEDSLSEDAQPSTHQTIVFRPEIVFQFLVNGKTTKEYILESAINRSQIFNNSHSLHNTSRTVLSQPALLAGQSSKPENPQVYGQSGEGSGEAGLGSQIHGHPVRFEHLNTAVFNQASQSYLFSKSISSTHRGKYDSGFTGSSGIRNPVQNDRMLTIANNAVIHNLSRNRSINNRLFYPDSTVSQALPPAGQFSLALAFRQALQASFMSALSSVNQVNGPNFLSAFHQVNQPSFAAELEPANTSATRPGFTGGLTTLFRREFSTLIKSGFTQGLPLAVNQRLSNREYPQNSLLLWHVSESIKPEHQVSLVQKHKQSRNRSIIRPINQSDQMGKESLNVLSLIEQSFYRNCHDGLRANLTQYFRHHQNLKQRFSPWLGRWPNVHREEGRSAVSLGRSSLLTASPQTGTWGFVNQGSGYEDSLTHETDTGQKGQKRREGQFGSKFPDREGFTERFLGRYRVHANDPAGFSLNSAWPSSQGLPLGVVLLKAVSAFGRTPGANFSFLYNNRSLNQVRNQSLRLFNRARLSNFTMLSNPSFVPIYASEFLRRDSRIGLGKNQGRSGDQSIRELNQIERSTLVDLEPFTFSDGQSFAQGLSLSSSQRRFSQNFTQIFTQSFNKNLRDYFNQNSALLGLKEPNTEGNGWGKVRDNLRHKVRYKIWDRVWDNFREERWKVVQESSAPFRPISLRLFAASAKTGALSPYQQKSLARSSSAPSSPPPKRLFLGSSVQEASATDRFIMDRTIIGRSILPGAAIFAEPVLSTRKETESSFPSRPVSDSRLLDGGRLNSSVIDRAMDKVIHNFIGRIIHGSVPGVLNGVGVSHRVVLNNSIRPVSPINLVGFSQEIVFKAGSGEKPYSARQPLSTSPSGMPYPQILNSPAALLNARYISTPYLNILHSNTSATYFSDLYNSSTHVPGSDHPVSDSVIPNPLDSHREVLKNSQPKSLSLTGRANQWISRVLTRPRAPRISITSKMPMTPKRSWTPWKAPSFLVYWESWDGEAHNKEAPGNEAGYALPFSLRNNELKTSFYQSGLRLIERLLGNVYRTLTHNHMEKHLAGKVSFEKSVAGNPLLTLLKNDRQSEERERTRLESNLVENYASFKSELETIRNLFAIQPLKFRPHEFPQLESPRFKSPQFKLQPLQSRGMFSPAAKATGQEKSQPEDHSGGLEAALSSPVPIQQSFEAWLFHRRGQVPVTVFRERPIPHLDGEKDIKIFRDLRTVSRYGEGAALLQADEARLKELRRKELRILRNTQLVALANPISYQDREREGPDMLILAPPVIAQDYNSGYTKSLPAITYREEEEKHRLNKQPEPVMKSLNTPVEISSPSLKQSIQNVDFMNPSELNRLVDKVYSQLETRLKREKRRFGF